MDNTLFDFHSAERAAYDAVSARFQLPDDDDTFSLYKRINTRHWQRLRRGETDAARLRLDRFRDFADALGLADADIQAMSDLYVQTLGMQHIPVDGAEAFLRRIAAHMPVVLVTNGFASVQKSRFSRSPLRQHVSDILISEEFDSPKPSPEMLHTAMRRMKAADPRRVVMIGDNEDTDIQAAVNAGTQSILFTNGAPPPERTQADFTAKTLQEAGEWILKE